MWKEESLRRGVPALYPEGMTKEQWPAYRKELLELLSREEYGFTPAAPEKVEALNVKKDFVFGGKAERIGTNLSFDTPKGRFSFPVTLVCPNRRQKSPLIIYISFDPFPGGLYCPLEEQTDNGYAVAQFNYQDVAHDCGDESGLYNMYPRRGDGTDWGRLGMWAFAASRVLDWALTLPEIDEKRVLVMGHSRLGKTALWAAAQDERFAGGISNDSGCSGAAVTREKTGERVNHIYSRFPYWFCENYGKYADKEHQLPFDQHQLLSLIAPRLLCVGSASEDSWADPESEYLGAYLASDAWKLLGKEGLVARAETMADTGENRHEGWVCYHLRRGSHCLSREDWRAYRDAADSHL